MEQTKCGGAEVEPRIFTPALLFFESLSQCVSVRACARQCERVPPSGHTRPQCDAEKAALSCGRMHLRRPPGGEDALKSGFAGFPGVSEEPPL